MAGADERRLRRDGVDHQRLAGPDVVGLPSDDDRHRAGQVDLAELDARQRLLPVDGVADRDARDGDGGKAGDDRREDDPDPSHALKVSGSAALHSSA